MTLAALLTVFSITWAILSAARPVGRRSVAMLVPKWRIIVAIILSFLCIVVRDAPFGIKPPFGLRLDLAEFGLTLGSLLVLVVVALWCWITWNKAKLTRKNIARLEQVIKTALREKEFDEIERILNKNKHTLNQVPANVETALFNPNLVGALVESDSMVHLELLSNMQFLTSLSDRLSAADVVGRSLLHSPLSPLRSAVVSRYGGAENLTYTDAQRALMERTFLKPEWYQATRADYPLVISTIETLDSGNVDIEYNNVGRAYEASQGISKRSQCPIYLATKTLVLSIEAAVSQKAQGDFYVSDMWNVFQAVQEHSIFNEEVWESDRANSEYPTPYAYLLYEIANDLEELSSTAVQSATPNAELRKVEAPNRIARDLAMIWSFCVWSIADSESKSARVFVKALSGNI